MIRKLAGVLILSAFLVLTLASCDGDFQKNPLGYDFVGSTYSKDAHKTINVGTSNAKPVAHLRPYGIGLSAEAFVVQYGQPLAPSQPPTQLWFRATLDDFPDGSIMIVGFDRSSKDSAPRATEISYVAGDKHPTTDTQAQTIAESFLPDDAQGPVVLNKYDAKANTCLSLTYTSATLATLFPPQNFLDGNGKLAKPGTITLSLFPHYYRTTDNQTGAPREQHANGDQPDQSNSVSSFLLTLGAKAYC